jgi:hypothetical protein
MLFVVICFSWRVERKIMKTSPLPGEPQQNYRYCMCHRLVIGKTHVVYHSLDFRKTYIYNVLSVQVGVFWFPCLVP